MKITKPSIGNQIVDGVVVAMDVVTVMGAVSMEEKERRESEAVVA